MNTIVILDEGVPLVAAPPTGDHSVLWWVLGSLAGSGLTGLSILNRRKRGEEG